MEYNFKDEETGEGVLVDFEMADAPKIGAVIRRNGRRLRRVVSQMQDPIVAGNNYTSFQHRRGSNEVAGADGYDSKGRPMFKSKSSARDFGKKKRDQGIIDMPFEQ